MPRRTPAECRERAEACERLAETTESQEVRETTLYMAARWRALAAQDEAAAQGRLSAQRQPQPRPHPSGQE